MKKVIWILFFYTGITGIAGVILGDVPADKKPEVQHLLNYVKNSECKIDRNGTVHDGKDALGHIQKKYDYYRNDIKTTEDFIFLSATKSTMSGKLYNVICPGGATEPVKDWLMRELKRYRTSGGR